MQVFFNELPDYFFVEEDFFRVVTFFTAPLTADVVSTAVSFTFSTALFTVFYTVLEVPFDFFTAVFFVAVLLFPSAVFIIFEALAVFF